MENNKYIIDYLIYSPSFQDYSILEHSNKVILNQKILDSVLCMDNLNSPMIFKISSDTDLGYYETFVSVHDFTASDDKIYVPYRIADSLLINRNDFINVDYYVPPKGNYIKLKPNQEEFYNIIDIKDFLGTHIQKYYLVLQKNSIITIPYQNTKIELLIKDCKPFDIITTVDTDISVDFDPFLENLKDVPKHKAYDKQVDKWFPFCGIGYRLGNK